MKKFVTFAAQAALCISAPAFAQDTEESPSSLELVKAEAELETARAERARAEADRIAALGLPSFEGKTELAGENAGAIESEMMSAAALRDAASRIAGSLGNVSSKKIILLTEADDTDLSQHVIIKAQIDSLTLRLRELNSTAPQSTSKFVPAGLSAAGILALVQAGAGLLRSETTLSGFEATSLSDQSLLWLTGQQLKAQVGINGRIIIPTANISGDLLANGNGVMMSFDDLIAELDTAKVILAELLKDKKPSAEKKKMIGEFQVLIERTNTYVNAISVAGDDGLVQLVIAARQADLMKDNPLILRLHLNKAGGSLVNTKNIATTFGVDPLKVSGAVLASYLLTDPKAGTLEAAGLIVCQTTLLTLRKVHEVKWRPSEPVGAAGAVNRCKDT